MQNFQTSLMKIKNIAGMFYTVVERKTSRLVIYGIGAPVPPDAGLLPDAPFILDYDVDLFVPDYIGFGRSDGEFTPINCIQTFAILFDEFNHGTIAKSGYLNQTRFLQYDEIYFIGRSFGGMYISWLPHINPAMKNLCLIFPILDYVACGKIPGEETTEGFMRAMDQDGYKHLYRGINRPVWQNHLHNKDNLCPMAQIDRLEKSNVFIAHGRQDKNINFSHSMAFFSKLQEAFPTEKHHFTFRLYDGGHNSQTSNQAVVDFLSWIRIPKIIN